MIMKSPVDKSSLTGCMQDTIIQNLPQGSLEASPHSDNKDVGTDVFRLHADRDACKGSTDTPKEATLLSATTLKLDKRFCKTLSDGDM